MRGCTMRPTSRAVWFPGVAALAMNFACLRVSPQELTTSVPESLKGEWTIVSIYKTSNISGISPEQAKSLVGSRIKYENGFLIACKQRVKIEKVEEKEVTATQFLAGRKRTSFSDVGINAPSIKGITINGNSSGNCFDTYALPGEDVYIKGQTELLIDFEGVYYRALRRAPASRKRSSGG